MRSLVWLFVSVATAACSLEPAPSIGVEPYYVPRGEKDAATPSPVSDAGTPPSAHDAGPPADAAVDDTTALASVSRGVYKTSPAFAHAVVGPYASTAATGSNVDEWVSANAFEAYVRIAPDVNGSHSVVPAGTMIVRAVLDASGAVAKLTLMMKGPPGYNPALGDWWFGETDPNGVPLVDDAGAMTGKMSGCYSCHLARDQDDFLFGVPAADRAAHP